jgi:hypothetical protein
MSLHLTGKYRPMATMISKGLQEEKMDICCGTEFEATRRVAALFL